MDYIIRSITSYPAIGMNKAGRLEWDISTVGTQYTPDGWATVSDFSNYNETYSGDSLNVEFGCDPSYALRPYESDALFSTYPFGATGNYVIPAGSTQLNFSIISPAGQNIKEITTGMNVTIEQLLPYGLRPLTIDGPGIGTLATLSYPGNPTAGVPAFAPPFVGNLSTATITDVTIAGTNATVTLSTGTIADIPVNSVLVFTTGTLVTWNGPSKFTFPTALDPYRNLDIIRNPIVPVFSISIAVDLFSVKYSVTGTIYNSTANSYTFFFDATPPVTIRPVDTIQILTSVGQYNGFSNLVCTNFSGNTVVVEASMHSIMG
jgi:hypothetical protein